MINYYYILIDTAYVNIIKKLFLNRFIVSITISMYKNKNINTYDVR